MDRLGIPLLPSIVRWFLVGTVAIVIFVFSIIFAPAAPPDPGPFWDKRLHFAAYAAFATTMAYATAQSEIRGRPRVIAVIGLAVLYGIAIEMLQAPLTNRYFSYADMVANALGALLGLTYLALETRLDYVPLSRLT